MRRRFSAIVFACILASAPLADAQSRRRSSPAASKQQATYANPVLDSDFPDPTVIRAADGLYYAYATQTRLGGRDVNIQVARSGDLVTWEHLGDALPVKPAWASETQNTWAPHVSLHGGTYFMYYSAEPNSKDGLCLAAATSKSPAGPFADSGKPMKCGKGFVNIDPMSFDDPATGKRLLYWGSGFEPIRVQELAPDRVSFIAGSEPIDLVSPKPGSGYERLIEGAWVVRRGGWYYLFYSGDNCCGEQAHYAVMVARSRSATGPFKTLAEATGRPESTLLVRSKRWNAPGHNSIFTDAAGRDWMFYHAIDPSKPKNVDSGGDRRVMLMDRVTYKNSWPVIAGGVPSDGTRPGPRVLRLTAVTDFLRLDIIFRDTKHLARSPLLLYFSPSFLFCAKSSIDSFNLFSRVSSLLAPVIHLT